MRRRQAVLVYGTALGVIALDQFTKWLVINNLAGRAPLNLVGSFVRLRYTSNSGGAFSLLTGFPAFFAIMALAISAAIVYYARRTTSTAVLAVLGLLLGGALGNLLDRLFRGESLFRGEVVDWIAVGTFPVFNVADSAITVGAITLTLLLGRAQPAPPEHPDAPGAPVAPIDPARPEGDPAR